MKRLSLSLLLFLVRASAAVPRACTGSVSLGSFQLTVTPPSKGAPRAIKSVDVIPAGSHLVWNPVHLPPQNSSSAEVAAALLPTPSGDLIFVEPRKAAKREDWVIPKSQGVSH